MSIFRSTIFRMFSIYSRETDLSQLKKLKNDQWLSHDMIKLEQTKKIRNLLKHAIENCIFYRERYSSLGIDTSFDYFTMKDLICLPVLTKNTLQQNFESMISDCHSNEQLFKNFSGGSTGVPTVVFQDNYRRSVRQADAIFRDSWTGWRLGEKVAILWGSEKDFLSVRTWRERIRAYCSCNVIELNAFELNELKTIKYLNDLQGAGVSLIVGYVGALTFVSRFILDNDVEIGKLRRGLKGIVATAERLTQEDRLLIEKAFGVKVFNRYGSREVGLIASECCEHDGLHVNSSCVIVEVVDKSGIPVDAGTVGHILVTDLYNYGMPLIRYDTGDQGFMLEGTCSCGRSLPRLGEIVGRNSDFFISIDGSYIHGEYFTHLVYGIDGVKQVQFIQDKNKDVNIRMVTSCGELSSFIVENITKGCIEKLGNIKVVITYVDEIKPSSSGKYLFTYSAVNS